MVAIALSGSSPKGKGVTMSILLLIAAFLTGLAVGTDPAGKDRNLLLDLDPVNSINRPEFDGIDLNLTNHIEPAAKLPQEINWNNAPLWAIRPNDRPAYLAHGASALAGLNDDQDTTPCEERRWGAELYKTYYEDSCPAKYHTDGIRTASSPFGTCESWNTTKDGLECTSFCQGSTQFEWAQETPFPNSDCHYPVKCKLSVNDKTSVGWSVNLSPKVGKALKLGISGQYHSNHDISTNHAYDIDLTEDLRCGYFSFIPVKKTTCGVLSESKPGLFYWENDSGYMEGGCNTHEGPDDKHAAWNDGNYCATELWRVIDRDDKNAMVPDGVVIFVYTDCKTRAPLPMEFQDEIYRVKGVALPERTVRAFHDSWIRNFCWFRPAKYTEDPNYKYLYLQGTGFEDNQIGDHNGTGIKKAISECAKGDVQDLEWYWDNPAEDRPEPVNTIMHGPWWYLEAKLPVETDEGCIGKAIMKIGGKTMDRCVSKDM